MVFCLRSNFSKEPLDGSTNSIPCSILSWEPDSGCVSSEEMTPEGSVSGSAMVLGFRWVSWFQRLDLLGATIGMETHESDFTGTELLVSLWVSASHS